MRCALCGGIVKDEVVTLDLRVEGELVVIEDIPMGVCQHCGEKYISAKISKKIDNTLTQKSKAKKKLEVPVRELP
jgi:YgiT-type zinc finger domain-containing protein